MSKNTKNDIPHETGIDIEDTDLDVPDLPGEWEWRIANHTPRTHKVNVYFGLNVHETGGWMGEIDNYIEDSVEVWDVHVRQIVAVPGEQPPENLPAETAETVEQFDSLDAAIESAAAHIGTHYPDST
jgi:hypothetical protein